jgi:hypothetical protein
MGLVARITVSLRSSETPTYLRLTLYIAFAAPGITTDMYALHIAKDFGVSVFASVQKQQTTDTLTSESILR